MKVLDEGHKYEMAAGQGITFVKKVGGELVYDGVQNDEVLEVLIDRMKYLQAAVPCRENALVITKLEEALMWLEKRTKDRVKRSVEGTGNK